MKSSLKNIGRWILVILLLPLIIVGDHLDYIIDNWLAKFRRITQLIVGMIAGILTYSVSFIPMSWMLDSHVPVWGIIPIVWILLFPICFFGIVSYYGIERSIYAHSADAAYWRGKWIGN